MVGGIDLHSASVSYTYSGALSNRKSSAPPPPRFIVWASCGVTFIRSVDAILGRSKRANITKKRPFASKLATPFGLGPKSCCLLPSLLTCSQEASVHDPTSWSFSDSRDDISPASGWKTDNNAHRPRRIGLRSRDARHGRQSRSAHCQMQKFPSVGKFHACHVPALRDRCLQRANMPVVMCVRCPPMARSLRVAMIGPSARPAGSMNKILHQIRAVR